MALAAFSAERNAFLSLAVLASELDEFFATKERKIREKRQTARLEWMDERELNLGKKESTEWYLPIVPLYER